MTGSTPFRPAMAALLVALGFGTACNPATGRPDPNGPEQSPRCATAVECHMEGLRWLRQGDDRATERFRALCHGDLAGPDRGQQIGPYGPSCLALARFLEPDDLDRAMEFFQVGCDLTREPRACRRIGEQRLARDPARAIQWLGQGCELGDAKSCLLFAARYQELSESPPADQPRSALLDRASDAYKRACGLTGNRAVCETGADLRTAAIVALEVEQQVADEEQARREARETADRTIREADEKREAARRAAAESHEVPIRVVTSLRCEDGEIDRFPAQDDVLVWIVFADGALQASLASWNAERGVRNGLTLDGARGGRGATLTGHMIKNRWVWMYELEAKITRSGRFRRGVLTTQYSTGDGSDCVSTAELEPRK